MQMIVLRDKGCRNNRLKHFMVSPFGRSFRSEGVHADHHDKSLYPPTPSKPEASVRDFPLYFENNDFSRYNVIGLL